MKYVCEYCGKDDFKTEAECIEHEKLCKGKEAEVIAIKSKETFEDDCWHCPICNARIFEYEFKKGFFYCIECGTKNVKPKE